MNIVIEKAETLPTQMQVLADSAAQDGFQFLHRLIEDYANGKDRAVGFLVGQVMKKSRGQANPGMVNKLLVELLKERIK